MGGQTRSLKEWRRLKLMSAVELAKAASVSLRAYGSIERGESTPRFGTMKRLAAVLEIDPLEIDEFRVAITGDETEEANDAR